MIFSTAHSPSKSSPRASCVSIRPGHHLEYEFEAGLHGIHWAFLCFRCDSQSIRKYRFLKFFANFWDLINFGPARTLRKVMFLVEIWTRSFSLKGKGVS